MKELTDRAMAGALFSSIAFFVFFFGLAGAFFPPQTANASTRLTETMWKFPIPLQLPPPEKQKTNAKEALGAVSCAPCHTKQFKQWNGGRHINSVSFGVMGLLFRKPMDKIRKCFNCHAPFYEQARTFSMFCRGREWKERPISIPYSFHAEGVTCAACHVRDHTVLAPPNGMVKKNKDEAPYHHELVVRSKMFNKSEFCKPCHQSSGDIHIKSVTPLGDTYGQWAKSRYADEGVQCQDCHMPNKNHANKGLRDPQTVKKAVSAKFQIDTPADGRVKFKFTITNVGAGHNAPSSPAAAILLSVFAIDDTGSVIGKKMIDIAGAEKNDKPGRINAGITPDETYEWGGFFTIPKGSADIVGMVKVAPDYYYQSLFKRRSESAKHRVKKIMLNRALKASYKSSYTLYEWRRKLEK